MTYEKAQALSVRFFEANPDADSNQWDDTAGMFACWIENFHLEKPSEDDWEECKDCFQGEFRNAGDFAEHLCEEFNTLEEIPENLRFYFDFDAYGRDLLMGDYWQSEGYYFRNL